jgi:hypothetical protein
MSDSQRAALEIADKIVGLGDAWGMHAPDAPANYYLDSGCGDDFKELIKLIAAIIDKHLC